MRPGELVDAWESLQADCLATGNVVRRRLRPDIVVDAFACAMPPGGDIGLHLEAVVPSNRMFGLLPNCRGMRITGAATLVSGAEHRLLLRIVLEDRRLLDVFSVLCLDLIGEASKESVGQEALKACLQRLHLWQGLIERMADDGLSQEAQRGLFGELSILETLLLPSFGPEVAVVSWMGPDGANQDFLVLGFGVEVKTSVMKKPVRLRIANEKQLDSMGLRGLLLCHVSVVATPMHGRTLPALVESLRAALGDAPKSLEVFDTQLVKAGYLEPDKERYESVGYSVSATDYYEVRDGFPRLVGDSIPLGLGDVTYILSVDAIARYRVDSAEVPTLLSISNG